MVSIALAASSLVKYLYLDLPCISSTNLNLAGIIAPLIDMLLSIRNNITLYQLVMLLLRSCAGLEIVRSQLAINFSEQGISYQYSFG